MKTPFLSLIVPAYNESATIVLTLSAMREYLSKQRYAWEIIVCADGADGTAERAREFAAGDQRIQVIGSPERRGKGRGVREGMLLARGEVIGFLDADYKTPIDEIERIYPALEAGYDVVIGSRRTGDARIEVLPPRYRQWGSKIFGLLMRMVMGLPDVRDTQCGFKFFTRYAARTIFALQRVDGYMFDVEVLRLCKLLRFGVKEIGVLWRDDGDSRYDPFFGSIRNVKELIRIRQMRYTMLPRTPQNIAICHALRRENRAA